jgi:hypothetical protein
MLRRVGAVNVLHGQFSRFGGRNGPTAPTAPPFISAVQNKTDGFYLDIAFAP